MAVLFIVGYQKIWRVAVNNKLLLLGPLFAALSSLWSESPVLTLRMSADLTITTLFAFYLSERFSAEHLMKLLMFVGTVGAIVSLFLVLFFPEYGLYHRGGGSEWQGIFSHKNALGTGMAFLLTPVFFSRQRPALKLGYGILLLFLIAMSQSRGAWFVTVGVCAFVGWLSVYRRLRGQESLLLTVATVAAALTMVVLGLLYLEPLMRFIGKDPTLTGRTEIYRAVLGPIFKHPYLGYGYKAFWFGANHESLLLNTNRNWVSIGYAENGFLELWLELGAAGLGLVLIMFGKVIRHSVRLIRHRYYTPSVGWFAVIIFLELITNIEAGQVMVPTTIEWLLTLIALVGLAKEVRTKDGPPRAAASRLHWPAAPGRLALASAGTELAGANPH
jgi:O-antigen ligase